MSFLVCLPSDPCPIGFQRARMRDAILIAPMTQGFVVTFGLPSTARFLLFLLCLHLVSSCLACLPGSAGRNLFLILAHPHPLSSFGSPSSLSQQKPTDRGQGILPGLYKKREQKKARANTNIGRPTHAAMTMHEPLGYRMHFLISYSTIHVSLEFVEQPFSRSASVTELTLAHNAS